MLFIFGINFFSNEKKDIDPISDPNAKITSDTCQEDVTIAIGFGSTTKKCGGPVFISEKANKRFCGKCQHIIKEEPPP